MGVISSRRYVLDNKNDSSQYSFQNLSLSYVDFTWKDGRALHMSARQLWPKTESAEPLRRLRPVGLACGYQKITALMGKYTHVVPLQNSFL